MTRRGMLGVGLLVVVALVAGYRPHIRMEVAPAHPTPHASAPARRPHLPSPPGSGNSIVTAALTVVARHTVVPLRGPEGLPGHPLQARLWLAAMVTATPTRYAVDLLWAPKLPPPIESPAAFFAQVANPHAVVPDGSFGGMQYPSAAAARAALSRTNAVFVPPPHRRPTVRVVAGTRSARLWTLTAGNRLLAWHEAGWTVELTGAVTMDEARSLARALVRHALPAGHGLIVEVLTPSHTTTVLDWRRGRDVYWTQAARVSRALLMARGLVSYHTVSATLLGYGGVLPPARALADVEQVNRLTPWIDLTAPQQNQPVHPGERLVIAGHILIHSSWISWTPTGPHVIGVSLLAGDTKPSSPIAGDAITVAPSGRFAGTLRVPYELPALNGPLLTLALQFSSRMAPVTQILLRSTPSPRSSRGRPAS